MPDSAVNRLRRIGFQSGHTGWSIDTTDEGEPYLFVPLSDEWAGLTIIPTKGAGSRYDAVQVNELGNVVAIDRRLDDAAVLNRIKRLT